MKRSESRPVIVFWFCTPSVVELTVTTSPSGVRDSATPVAGSSLDITVEIPADDEVSTVLAADARQMEFAGVRIEAIWQLGQYERMRRSDKSEVLAVEAGAARAEHRAHHRIAAGACR